MTKQKRLLPTITGLFVATLLISNTIAPKIFDLFGLPMSVGIIVFPLAYVFADVLTEVYGYAQTRRVIWIGIAAQLLMIACYEVARILPAASFWKDQPAFDAVFSSVPRMVAASILAYFCGEFVNSYVVAKMKVMQKGKNISIRFVMSTLSGQFVDTIIVLLVAFSGTMPWGQLGLLGLTSWLLKVLWEVIALPLTIPVVRFVKKVEDEDFYDMKTNFSPFHLS